MDGEKTETYALYKLSSSKSRMPPCSGTIVGGKRYSFADASGYWSGGRSLLLARILTNKVTSVFAHLHGGKYQFVGKIR